MGVMRRMGSWTAMAGAATLAAAGDDRAPDFAREVRPILSNFCFKCHGPDDAARKSGLRLDSFDGATSPALSGGVAVAPGKAALSELIRRVSSGNDDERMPPPEVGPGLTPTQVDILRRWIDHGAAYEPHWAFVPPRAPDAPTTDEWARVPFDAMVAARLASEGLRPSPEAGLEALVRRASLDLTGLPPTQAELEVVRRDSAPGAYERAVDRMLASPAFGERWTRVWLDLARYADTRGYEKDDRRLIWPWRDWVIRAINRDMPFTQFTIEQIAGDLLPDPTPEQILATAFHRNTMNNDEGGTDDEEFRVAAVIDRTNTTMQAWMGLTAGCAQCHTHKFDPISQREYYGLLAFFNTSADADRTDEHPLLRVMNNVELARRDALLARRDQHEREIGAIIDATQATESPLPVRTDGEHTTLWLAGDPSPGANFVAQPPESVAWVDGAPVSDRALRSTSGGGITQQYVDRLLVTHMVAAGDRIIVRTRIDPERPPKAIMVQVQTGVGDWEHRAVWGEDAIGFGTAGTPSRMLVGALPAPGEWTALDIDPQVIGLAPGAMITGIAWTHSDGVVEWDAAGVRSSAPSDDSALYSQHAWETMIADGAGGVPDEIRAAAKRAPAERSAEEIRKLRTYYVRNVFAPARAAITPLRRELESVQSGMDLLNRSTPEVPVMQEQDAASRRTTHVFQRGDYRSKGEVVEPSTPAFLHALPPSQAVNRLALATWIVDERNPLTARVFVNRVWEQMWGIGLVETVEDFGYQGAFPSHPDVLDRLAVEFMRSGWSLKALCRTIVLSSTYRQTSDADSALVARDPANRLLARGARLRLDGEAIRDRALAVSGLLSPRMYGPPVFPPQPDGVWAMVYSNDRWVMSEGEDRVRRGLYTFWRRTSPYPSIMAFDAGSREACLPRRIRTNTPLQALVTLNDPAYVEAAQAMARRVPSGATPNDGAARILSTCLSRPAREDEVKVMAGLFTRAQAALAADAEAATALACDPIGPAPAGANLIDLAAWTAVSNAVMNLDEFLVKE